MKNTDYINIHTHHHSDEGIAIQNVYEKFESYAQYKYVSIGIHPWHIKSVETDKVINFIAKNADAKNVLAIGECGLDKLIDTDITEQENKFKAQIKIAEEVKKPLIIHCVKAFDDLIRIKKEMNVSVPMIIHGYNNNLKIAEQLLKNDFYFSFGKALLTENSNASKIISMLSIEKIFFETDDEHLSIKSIFDAGAKHLKMDVEDLKDRININFKRVFK